MRVSRVFENKGLWVSVWSGLVAVSLVFDLLTPPGYTIPFLYVPLLLMTWFSRFPVNAHLVATGLMALTWAGFIFSPDSETSTALFNRAMVSVVLLTVATGLEQRRNHVARTETVQASLHETESRYRALVESLPQLVWTCRADGPCDYLSPQWIAYTGRPELEQLGYGWLEQIHPEDRDDLMANWRRAVESRLPFEVKFRIRRADGIYRWFLTRAVPVLGSDGAVLKWYGSNSDIEELIQTKHALHTKEQEFIRATAQANVGVWDWCLKTNNVTFSAEWKRQLGYEEHEIGEGFDQWRSRVHPDDAGPALAAARRCIDERASGHFEAEFRMRRKDGTWRWMFSRGTLIMGRDGHPARLAGIQLDVTAFKESESALRASEERYRLAEAGTNDGLWDWKIGTGEDYLSPRWKELLGYRDDELPNHAGSFIRHLHPDDSDRVRQALLAHLIRRAPYDLELRLRHKSGSYRWFHVRGQAIWNERGKPIRMTGSLADISVRKEAERALVESERRFQLVSQAMQDTILDWDLVANQLEWSKGIETQWGYAKDRIEWTGDWWIEQIHPEDRERVVASLRETLEGAGTVWSGEYRQRRADEAYAFVLDRGFVVRDAGGRAIRMIGVKIDMTQAKSAEETRRRQEVMERLFEEREAIARNLHDGVLQSMYAVKLGLERSRRVLSVQPEKADAHLDRQIQDVGLVISEMRRFLEGQEPAWARAPDLQAGLNELLDLCRATSSIEWELRLSGAFDVPAGHSTDETRHLMYIVREAVSNVIRHANARRCRMTVDQVEGGLRLAVEDDGTGFPSGQASQRGRGLGNMEARARHIGAAINLSSTPGVGTRVTIDLIRREAHAAI